MIDDKWRRGESIQILWLSTQNHAKTHKQLYNKHSKGCGRIEILWQIPVGVLALSCGHPQTIIRWTDVIPWRTSGRSSQCGQLLGWVAFLLLLHSRFGYADAHEGLVRWEGPWSLEREILSDFLGRYKLAHQAWEKAEGLSCQIRALTPIHWQRYFRLTFFKRISIILRRLRAVRRGAFCCWRYELRGSHIVPKPERDQQQLREGIIGPREFLADASTSTLDQNRSLKVS